MVFVALGVVRSSLTHSPHVRQGLDRSDGHQQHTNVLPLRIVAILVPSPPQPDPKPKAQQQVEDLDVAAQHYIVPFQHYLLMLDMMGVVGGNISESGQKTALSKSADPS